MIDLLSLAAWDTLVLVLGTICALLVTVQVVCLVRLYAFLWREWRHDKNPLPIARVVKR